MNQDELNKIIKELPDPAQCEGNIHYVQVCGLKLVFKKKRHELYRCYETFFTWELKGTTV